MITLKKNVLIAICICICCGLSSQNRAVEAFLNFEYKEFIDIYDSANGNVIHKIRNGMYDEDDIIIFNIKESTDSMFHVTAFYNYEKDSVIGWIKKSNNIGVYSRAYCSPLKLYIRPNIN